MRSCRPFTTPSSIDDINNTKAEMDEAASPASLLEYESALIRSEDQTHVLHGLDYLSKNDFEEQEQRVKTVYLKALANYRLKRDKECLKIIQDAKAQSISSAEIDQIRDTINKEAKEEQNEKIATGVGIGATIVVGIATLAAIIFGATKKRK